MANALYTAAREGFGNGVFNWLSDTFRLVFVDHADDTPVPGTDDNLDDISAPARVATSNALASKTNVGGVMDADDILVSAVTGDEFESITLYKSTGTDSTSRLGIYWDTATGLPYTPSGVDVLVIFDNGANKVWKI